MTPRQFKVVLTAFTFLIALQLGVYWKLTHDPLFLVLACAAVGTCILYCIFF